MAEIPANDKGDSIDMEQPPQLAYHSTLATLSKAHHYTSPYFSQPISATSNHHTQSFFVAGVGGFRR